MISVIPVKFAYAVHELWFDPGETGAQAADHVIVSTERGTEIGLVTRDAFEVTPEELGDTIEDATLQPVLRVATADDLAYAEVLAEKGTEALPVFRRAVENLELDMKPVGVEYLFGGEKVVCYFAAEDRIDFRQLVRDLSHELHERIDMRQIGVREEAAIVGGYAHCGQELCCARFGRQFEPVSIRMAKEQDLPLNSNKISGACGRLMCCLRYEFEAYRDFKSRAPKKNAVIDTPLGKAKIVEYDTPKEQLCLRLESGKQVRVPLAEMEASEAAHKKSEELGCPCRPDTVLRSTLEKINSPQIQMALAELDRKNGLTPAEVFDVDDLFVNPVCRQQVVEEPSRSAATTEKKTKSSNKASAKTNASQEEQGRAKPTRRRRVRKSSQAQPSQQQQERRSSENAAVQAASAPTRRRRHHRVAASEKQQAASPSAGTRTRHTRRPGDKDGAQARQPQANTKRQARQDNQERRSLRSRNNEAGETTPRRRRHHRGGRGRGHSEGNASSRGNSSN